MKTILTFLIVLASSFTSYAVVTYAPTSTNTMTGSAGYCLSATASPITFTYNTCHAGTGTNVGVADTIRWYKNTANSTTGGTLVNTTVSTCALSNTGSVSYTPSTAAVGVLYYYCKITWAGSGVCNGTGSLTSSLLATITVQPPSTPISGSASVCTGLTTIYTDSTAGGAWSSSNTSIASVSASGVVRGISSGSATISYNTGCGSPAVKTITVNQSSAAITGRTSICFNADTARLDTTTFRDATSGGAWSSSNSAIASVNASTGLVTGMDTGTVVISYIKTFSVGSCTATANLSVITVPYPVISGSSHVCLGAEITLTGSGYYGTGGVWTSADPGIEVIDNSGIDSGNSVGTTSIYYAVTNACGISTASTSVTVYPLPLVDTITGSSIVCIGGTTVLGDTTTGGTWHSDDASIASVDAAGTVTGVSAGSVIISYSLSTAYCGSDYNTITMFVPAVGAGTISGPSMVPIGSTLSFSDTLGGGVWSGSNPALASVNASTGVVTGLATGVDTIIYTVTNSCGTSNAFAVVSVSALSWVGGVAGHETDWKTAGNWTSGYVPGQDDNVTIHAGTLYVPEITISETATVKNLTIDSAATVKIDQGAILNVKGDIYSNGTVNGAGALTINGTAAQHIYGAGSCAHLTLNNTNGVTIDSTATFTINKSLNLVAGTLHTGNNLILGSDSAGTAYVAPIPASGASVSGKVTVMQYMTGGRRAYRFWAHPFDSSIALSQLTGNIDITGAGGATNGFTTTATNAPSAYHYSPVAGNSLLAYDPGWKPFTSAYASADSNELHPYQGIRIFYRGAKGEGMGFGPYTVISSATLKMTGNLNQGNQAVTLRKGASAGQDYNMVGNPYASPVDIGTIIFNAAMADKVVGASFYVWNPFLGVAGQFESIPYSTGGTTPVAVPYYIQSNDAFQVRAAHDSDELVFTENDKSDTVSSAYSLMRTNSEFLSLNIYDANYHLFDKLQIKFNDIASEKEDGKFDARKLAGPDFNFYSISTDNRNLAIDARPYHANGTISLGLNCNFATDFVIRAEQCAIPTGAKVYLHDKLLGRSVLLQQGTEYKFSVTADKNTQGNNRFELSLDPENATAPQSAAATGVSMVPNPATDDVTITFTSEKAEKLNINVLDASGVNVFNKSLGIQKSGSVTIPLQEMAAGIYFVEIISGNEKTVRRLIKE